MPDASGHDQIQRPNVSGLNLLTEAEGRVELRQSGYLVLADRLSYRPLDDEVEASGNVHMARAGVQVDAPYLKMRMSEQMLANSGET